MFRFTIRDALWLMVVVGLACGWWMDRTALDRWHRLRFGKLVRDAERSLMTVSGEKIIIDERGQHPGIVVPQTGARISD